MNPEPAAVEVPSNFPSTSGMTTRVVKGSLWTLLGQAGPLAISFVATPFIIRLLGSEGYGVLILVGLIPTYLGFADIGMSIASTKFGSEAYAARDPEREASTVRAAAVIALFVSVPVAVAIFAFSGQIATLFNVPDHLIPEATLALKIGSGTFVVNFLNAIFNTPQLARLRMDLNTLVTSGFRMAGIIATPIVIYLGGGIVGAITVLLICALATLFGHIYVSGRLLPPLYGFKIDRSIFWPLLKVGGPYAISTMAAMCLGGSEKFILTHYTTVKDLAYYSVAFTIATMLTMFSASMTQSLIPAFSQLQADDDRERRSNIYSRCIRIVLIAFVPILVLVAVAARPFLTLWAGKEFGIESVLPLHILMLGLVLNVIAFFPVSVIIASGRTDALAKLYWIELSLYVPLVFWLVSRYGAVGAAAAWSIRVGADAIVLFVLAKRISSVSIGQFSGKAMIAFAVIVIPFILIQFYDEFSPSVLVASAFAYMVYGIMVWNLLLEKEELAWMRMQINAMLYR